MRLTTLPAMAFVAALALPGCTQQGPLIRVTVELKGFARGCVRVLAGRPGDPEPQASEIQLDPAKPQGVVLVAVFPDPAWGPSVEVVAQAREGSCTGLLANVDRRTVQVTPAVADARLVLTVDD